MTTEEREKKNSLIAWVTSVGFHVVLFLIFLFAVAWRAPDPPLPQVGIELNFGLDRQGSGDVQPETPVGTQQQETKAEDTQKEKPEEDVKPAETKPQESKPVEQPVVTKQESPVTVKKEEKKEAEKPKEKVQEKTEDKKPVKEEVKVEYKKPAADKTESKSGQTGSEGDDKDKTGNKGDSKGSLDPAPYVGKPGGGGGVGLSMAGWDWAEKPKAPTPTENDQFSGKVVFKIEVDADGFITKIDKIEGNLSYELERKCKESIQKSSLQKNSTGKAADRNVGLVVFYLRIE
jgi:periplasmic protein TonB